MLHTQNRNSLSQIGCNYKKIVQMPRLVATHPGLMPLAALGGCVKFGSILWNKESRNKS